MAFRFAFKKGGLNSNKTLHMSFMIRILTRNSLSLTRPSKKKKKLVARHGLEDPRPLSPCICHLNLRPQGAGFLNATSEENLCQNTFPVAGPYLT